jgi:tetratricopeptide (TPR) repeat protein
MIQRKHTRIAVFLVASLALCASARAADTLAFAPQAAWVTPVPVPPARVRDPGRSLQILLLSVQDRYDATGMDSFTETAMHIQTNQGLSDIGNTEIAWNPQTQTPVVHRLRVLRDGQWTDVLAKQRFTILRRETNLDNAMLDGVLTAVVEPEGLQVGDVVDFAYSIHTMDPVLRGHAETLYYRSLLVRPNHFFARVTWPTGRPVRSQRGEGFAAPKLTVSGPNTDYVVDMADVEAPAIPQGAPARYGAADQMELSDLPDWAAAADLFSPYYTKASVLAAASPLQAEITRIAAASPDPAQRAALALQLVQDKIRYVFLGDNSGNYVPAAADLTWSRRFGDCKGKTVLLLALLHGLGIEAVPALVSTEDGDGLDTRLPTVGRFDHVIVRAVIAKKIYWLDGTRLGDRALDQIQVPPYYWALPLRPNSGLEKLQVAPLAAPDEEVAFHADATAGLFTPATLRGEITLHGAAAEPFRIRVADMPRNELEVGMRKFWREYGDAVQPDHVDFAADAQTGDVHMSFTGHLRLDWLVNDGDLGRDLRLDVSRLEFAPDFDRAPGPHADAPFRVSFPLYRILTEDIALPNRGAGFIAFGRDIDRVSPIAHWHREAKIKDGVLHLALSEQTLAPELPAAAAPALADITRKLRDSVVFLHVNRDAPWTDQDFAVRDTMQLSDPDDLLERGRHRWTRHKLDPALADFDGAAAAAPGNTKILVNRGLLQIDRGKNDLATADFDAVIAVDPAQAGAWYGRGRIAERQLKYADAVSDYSHALESRPNDAPSLSGRARAYRAQGDTTHALADFAEAIRLAPDNTANRLARINMLLAVKQGAQALQDADAFVAQSPHDPYAHWSRTAALHLLGRNAEAVTEVQSALAIKPSPGMYMDLAEARPASQTAEKLKDADAALRLDPHFAPALLLRGSLLMQTNATDAAVAAYQEAVRAAPSNPAVLSAAEQAFEKLQRHDLMLATLDQLVKLQPDSALWLNNRCWARATSGGDPTQALADCDAALKIKPDAPDALDSRGFVHLRLGQFAAAKQDYDAALKARPDLPTSLYGRGVALSLAGNAAAGSRDLDAARKHDPGIDKEFAGYGVKVKG